MSIELMSLVWKKFPRGGSDKLVMLAMADWGDDMGGRIYPSIPKLAAKVNVSESQARRIVHGLINDGYLLVTDNHNGGDPGKPRHYQMVIEKLITPSVCATPSMDATPSTNARRPLAPMRETPSMDATLYINKPLNNPLTINNGKKQKSSKPKKTEVIKLNPEIELLKQYGVEGQIAIDFLIVRKKKKLPLTETAMEGIIEEAEKANLSVLQAVTISTKKGWGGFDSTWNWPGKAKCENTNNFNPVPGRYTPTTEDIYADF